MWDKLKASPYYHVAKGAAVAAAGAVLAYLAHWAAGSDAGTYGPLVGAAAAFALDALHHAAGGNEAAPPAAS